MKSITLKLVSIALFTVMLISCSAEEDGIYSGTSYKVEDISLTYSTIEYEIVYLVNQHRESIGLSSLNTFNLVSREADGHTNYMLEVGELSHDNFGKRSTYLMDNADAIIVAENVAYGFGTAEGVVNAWLNSEKHKATIENPTFTDFGISTEANELGRNYFTNIFIKR
jgi:uncharacterized protein YkwD